MREAERTNSITSVDESMMVAHAKSSREAFAPLYVLYFDRVFAYCYRRLDSYDDASDATSAIFARVLEALPQCRDHAFRSWLFAIAHNTLIDLYRSRRRHSPIDDMSELADRHPSPEEEALTRETGRSVAALLALLPADQAHVLELRLAGLTSREIGDILGKNPNAVDQAQYRAVQRLRALLASSSSVVEGLL